VPVGGGERGGEEGGVAVVEPRGGGAQLDPALLGGRELGGRRVGEDGGDDGGARGLALVGDGRAAEVDADGRRGDAVDREELERGAAVRGGSQRAVAVQREDARGGIRPQVVEQGGRVAGQAVAVDALAGQGQAGADPYRLGRGETEGSPRPNL
jgi:hypothetical protein